MNSVRLGNIVPWMCLILIAVGSYGCVGAAGTVRSDVAVNRGQSMYAQGDHLGAAAQFRNAAELGNAQAQFELGQMYANGEGVGRSTTEAVSWIRRAADQAYPPADVDLGVRYLFGNGVPQDNDQAAFHFRRAADNGYILGMYYMGFIYTYGLGVEQSTREALRWYRLTNAYGFELDSNLLTEAGIERYRLQAEQRRPAQARQASVSAEQPVTREMVRGVQQGLKDLGYDPGPIDGLYGNKTRTAIQAFQRDQGINPDGNVSQRLLDSIRAKAAGR